jgi:hypothetical protein
MEDELSRHHWRDLVDGFAISWFSPCNRFKTACASARVKTTGIFVGRLTRKCQRTRSSNFGEEAAAAVGDMCSRSLQIWL